MSTSLKISLLICLQVVLLGAFTPANAFSFSSLFGGGKKAEEKKEAPGADIQKQLDASILAAKSAFGQSDPKTSSLLDTIKSQAGGSNDVAMLQSLSGLMGAGGAATAMMTPAQTNLLSEVKGHAQALALTRSFSDDPSLQGPVTTAAKAIQAKDPITAATSLKTISDQAKLTPVQQIVMRSLMGDYAKYLDHAGKAADAIDSVNRLIPAGMGGR